MRALLIRDQRSGARTAVAPVVAAQAALTHPDELRQELSAMGAQLLAQESRTSDWIAFARLGRQRGETQARDVVAHRRSSPDAEGTHPCSATCLGPIPAA
jgi:hypothetical protein